jgi:hypothetical protein
VVKLFLAQESIGIHIHEVEYFGIYAIDVVSEIDNFSGRVGNEQLLRWCRTLLLIVLR